MVNKMSIDKKIISEIERYRQINNYIKEQAEAVPPPPPPPAEGEETLPTDAAAPVTPTEPEKIDVTADPDVEKIDDEGKSEEKTDESGTEELDITDLVDSQKNIENKQNEYFENLFSQLSNLETKLKEMDGIMNKLNSLEMKIEKYREKTPQEKLELRAYDSYPFNQRLTDFFEDKKEEMELTGKHDYVLTSDEVKDINVNDIKNSFQPGGDIDNYGSKIR